VWFVKRAESPTEEEISLRKVMEKQFERFKTHHNDQLKELRNDFDAKFEKLHKEIRALTALKSDPPAEAGSRA
jgi:phage host-nuclease inhibitor protein Gam